ncbi:MAG: RNA polymerase sigma factor [Verrucomicrobia bacterium]|nr:RNA polymerase sigma factor [Verrucomicrobiota bacterium]
MDDTLLVREIQQGNQRAFEQLLDRHVHHVRAFLALKAPVAHLVDELTHETFVFAFHNIRKFTVGTSVQAWLRAIAWNLLRAEIQRFSREQVNQTRFAAHSICEGAQTASDSCAPEAVEFLEYCLEEVPPKMRELLALKYREDHSSQEIAQHLHQSVAWVYTMLFRVRQQLKDCIKRKMESHRPC